MPDEYLLQNDICLSASYYQRRRRHRSYRKGNKARLRMFMNLYKSARGATNTRSGNSSQLMQMHV